MRFMDIYMMILNPLTVSVNSSGEERLVLELRHVIKFVDKQKVKFEGVNEALAFTNNSKYMNIILMIENVPSICGKL
jgi:hypothetical protein